MRKNYKTNSPRCGATHVRNGVTLSLLCLAGVALAPVVAFADPVPVSREAPNYPKGAEARGIEGSVTLKFNVDAGGNVVAPQVVDATPPGVFDAAAIEALTKWKYAPGSAASDVQVKLSFKLN
jgi:periplasmic protein TonB